MKILPLNQQNTKLSFKELSIKSPTAAKNNTSPVPYLEPEEESKENNKQNSKNKKIAYVSGAIVLAGLGVFAFRHQLGLAGKKIKEEGSKLSGNGSGKDPLPPPKKIIQNFIDFVTGKKHEVELTDMYPNEATLLINRKWKSETNRLIRENEGLSQPDFLKTMEKISEDYSKNQEIPERFDVAANILEQSYVKRFLSKEKGIVEGIDKMLEHITGNGKLFNIYDNLPAEQVIDRVNTMRTMELSSQKYKGMNGDDFFKKIMSRFFERKAEVHADTLFEGGKPAQAADFLEDFFVKSLFNGEKMKQADTPAFIDILTDNRLFYDIYGKMPEEELAQRMKLFVQKNSVETPELKINPESLVTDIKNTVTARNMSISRNELLKNKEYAKAADMTENYLLDLFKSRENQPDRFASSVLGEDISLLNIYRNLGRDEAILRIEKFQTAVTEAAKPQEKEVVAAYFEKLEKHFKYSPLDEGFKKLKGEGKIDEATDLLEDFYTTKLLSKEKPDAQDLDDFADALLKDSRLNDIYKDTDFRLNAFRQLTSVSDAQKKEFDIKLMLRFAGKYADEMLPKTMPQELPKGLTDLYDELFEVVPKENVKSAIEVLASDKIFPKLLEKMKFEEANKVVEEISKRYIGKIENKDDQKLFKNVLESFLSPHRNKIGLEKRNLYYRYDDTGIFSRINNSNQKHFQGHWANSKKVEGNLIIINENLGPDGKPDLNRLKGIAWNMLPNEAYKTNPEKVGEYYDQIHKCANLLEQGALGKYRPNPAKQYEMYAELENAFLSQELDTLFEIYKKLPKEDAIQRLNVFRLNSAQSHFDGMDFEKHFAKLNEFLDKTIARLG